MHKIIQNWMDLLSEIDEALTEMEPFLTEDKHPLMFADGEMAFDRPYSAEMIRDTENLFKEHGFSRVDQHIFTDDGVLSHTYDRSKVRFIIYFRPHMDGSTCKLNLIGEETKKVPIYEVVCGEALAEVAK